MGILDFVKSQFIEVIEWTDPPGETMVYRFPVQGNEIKMGAQLTVRESQVAIFVSEGQIADVFQPGRYELTTQVLPILGKLKAWKYGFNSPFKSEVYFINTRQFLDQKWGTQNPVMMRDAEFGMLRLRAFGIYSFRVINPEKFMKEVFGTQALLEASGINEQLRRMIVSGMTDSIAEAKVPALDLAQHYDELSELVRKKMEAKFEPLGLGIPSLYIENISLPPEVEAVLDRRTSMGVIGDMGKYTQYQAAEALRDAATTPNSMAGAGMGLGAGVSLGQVFAQSMASAQAPAAPQAAGRVCPHCKAAIAAEAKFCPVCGKPTSVLCRACNHPIPDGSKFCPDCGVGQSAACPSCGKPVGDAKFCPDCGAKVG